MGTPAYSNPDRPSLIDSFITWLNGRSFPSDEMCKNTLEDIQSECATRLSSMEGEAAIDKAEAEGS